jgi:type I restriction enzyme R subunit
VCANLYKELDEKAQVEFKASAKGLVRTQNAMRNANKQEARTESDRVLQSVVFSIMADNMELFKQFNDNPTFKKWLSDMVFATTYKSREYEIQEQELPMVAEEREDSYPA